MYKINNTAKKLNQLRIYKGFKNQTQAAQALGMSRHQYNLYETGNKEPGLTVILKICNIFEIDIHYFFNNGKPEEFDVKATGRRKDYDYNFIQTTVSNRLFAICHSALNYKNRILANVLALSGVTTSLKEFTSRHSDCCLIDALENLKKPVKRGVRLYIIDHGHYPAAEDLNHFLEELRKENAGIVLITKTPFQSRLFEEVYFIQDLSFNDINRIILDNFSFLEDIAQIDNLSKQKILMTITGEVFYNPGKIKELINIFSNSFMQNFSVYNLLKQLINN